MNGLPARTPVEPPPKTAGLVRFGFRAGLALYLGAIRVARAIGRSPRKATDRKLDVLLTGTFYSENWVRAHVRPLALSARCERVRVVSTFNLPPLENVEAVYPPRWLARIIGGVPARLATFVGLAIKSRPDVVGGFHLLVNGLVAALVARLVGARSLYFCVGGPWEVLDGGVHAENRLFSRLRGPDATVERQLIRTVDAFDSVITMGAGAVRYFRDHGVKTDIQIVSGGLDVASLRGRPAAPAFDIILVARLAAIKRIDLFLKAVALVRQAAPAVTAAVVGDGALRPSLEKLAADLGLQSCVTFAGHQRDVGGWLRRSRLFVLTSESEGLALSLMEAMAAGLPAVVSAVGDLGDLVEEGVNGHLVTEASPEAFADRIGGLLRDGDRLRSYSQAAEKRATRYDVPLVARQWDDILGPATDRLMPISGRSKHSLGDVANAGGPGSGTQDHATQRD